MASDNCEIHSNESKNMNFSSVDPEKNPIAQTDNVHKRKNRLQPSSSSEKMEFCNKSSKNGENSSLQTFKTAAEYANAVRQWMFQYHCWQTMNQYNHMMAYCMSQNLASDNGSAFGGSTTSNGSIPRDGSTDSATGEPPNTEQGYEYKVAPIWKRVMAELFDFILLLLVKFGVVCMLVDVSGGLSWDYQPLDIETLISDGDIDLERLLNVTSEVMIIEVINRIFISVFEAMCLRQGIHMIGGSTPGKRVMGLCVVSCVRSTDLPNQRVLVIPAQNIGFWNALKRSVIKNFSMAFLFPICITALFFQNGQAAYDMLSNCIVVEDGNRRDR